MRAAFAQALVDAYDQHPRLVFVTNDLGYMALEPVMAKYGERFINAGVAEQNMISCSAGMAREGLMPWVYSIAPFTVFRPYEQIRNDVCLHNLPVKIVGNGGGYGYGIMGATHHALEDIAVMRALPNMTVHVPLNRTDVAAAVSAMLADESPNYLRLNMAAALPRPIAPFAQWRRIHEGSDVVIIGAGPVLGNLFEAHESLLACCEVWSIGTFPVKTLPSELVSSVRAKRRVLTIEEHTAQCGLNETVARLVLQECDTVIRYRSLHAQGYPSGRYGSQRWHQEENGLAGPGLFAAIREMVES